MSTHLRTDLHAAIDGGTQDSPLTSADLLRRIRRRRAVRSGAQGAVGLVAAGAVTAGGVHLAAGSGDGELRPGTTCGTDVAAWARTHRDDDLRVVAQPSGREMSPQLRSLGDVDEGREVGAGGPLGEWAGRTLELVAAHVADDHHAPGDGAGMRVMLARDGEVVGWAQNVARGDDAASTWQQAATVDTPEPVVVPGTTMLTAYAWLDLHACAGSDLPAGTYDVYVGDGPVTANAPVADVASGWTVDLLDPGPAVTGLPDDFPVDDVPVLPGELVAAAPHVGGGWHLEVRVPGVDAHGRAWRLLAEHGAHADTERSLSGYVTASGDWTVDVQPWDRGERISYDVRPVG
ncbi:hypothetical protein ACFO3K_16455 [Cellulomonas algicola]|uniref:Uncharacterized protein n=1 Tax=Cellulomonas algicola TaxID=2071633 RepID=A0A401V4F1_9CELL|nr:hypothetical protein [Cellulomonas algicola]GCD21810.1 hypothetical protein CTKZ_33720 [Cellulomonas algicola]